MPTNPAERMKQLEAKHERLQETVRDAESALAEVDDEILALVRETVAPMFPEVAKHGITYLTEWGWECDEPDKNPFLLCVYDDSEDPCLDDCLFCHQPYERK